MCCIVTLTHERTQKSHLVESQKRTVLALTLCIASLKERNPVVAINEINVKVLSAGPGKTTYNAIFNTFKYLNVLLFQTLQVVSVLMSI